LTQNQMRIFQIPFATSFQKSVFEQNNKLKALF
jgi:hypothetical protein